MTVTNLTMGFVVLATTYFSVVRAPCAWGQNPPSPVSAGLLVTVRGDRTPTVRKAGRHIRRQLANVLGPLRSSSAWRRALAKLGARAEHHDTSNIARAARVVGARHVLDLRATKQATGTNLIIRLIRAVDGQILVYEELPVPREADVAVADHVFRVTIEALAKEGVLAADGTPLAASDETKTPLFEGALTRTSTAVADSAWVSTSTTHSEPMASASGEGMSNALPVARPYPDTFDLTLGLGSGLYRDYRVSTEAIDRSRLSHRASPVPLFRVAARVMLDELNLGLRANFEFRTQRYTIQLGEAGEIDPQGYLIDLELGLIYRLRWGRVDIMPRAGVRLNVSSVDDQEFPILVSATAVTPTLGIGLLWQGDGWDARAAADVGWTAVYEERPRTTGERGQGPGLLFRSGLTFWLTEELGVGLDTALSVDVLSFDGALTRTVPNAEEPDLSDANLTIIDWRATASARIRL